MKKLATNALLSALVLFLVLSAYDLLDNYLGSEPYQVNYLRNTFVAFFVALLGN
ncbi:hypothetical protein [Neolewinella antarctica]|uniref:Uncharacterized protein n=1 Tax=Neolewinella antarctica TaxID=442734 RepID=A0ABX0XFI4_9BACT|nr:hypothetical protein [Neolewinella antarctica]NJC27890.1 hypothetical protein [Neolewinella antarctica]